MRVSAVFAIAVFSMALSIGAGSSYAGFGYSYLGGASGEEETAQQNIKMDGTPLPKTEKTPALQVFDDKYVPDAVRKKFNLNDNWYGADGHADTVNTAKPELEVMPAPISAPIPVSVPLPAPVVTQAPETIVQSWRARKGEALRDVLQRWSTRDETNLMWASPDAPVLPKDFSFVGKYQDAVNALIKEAGGANIHTQYRSEGLSPVMSTPASTVTTNAPAPLPDNVAVVPAPQSLLSKVFEPEQKKEEDRKPETKWFGLSGAQLSEVIQVWSDDAGIRLIWQADRGYALKESVSRVGKYEDAIFEALNQYSDDDVRPVGEMYNDPQSGERVLVVRTEVK